MKLTKNELEKFPSGTKIETTKGNIYTKHRVYGDKYMWSKNGHNDLSHKTMTRKEVVKVLLPRVEYDEWTRPEEVLDHVEKVYLGTLINPYKHRVEYIEKVQIGSDEAQIWIYLKYCEPIILPKFNAKTMYKNMKPDIHYPACIVDEVKENEEE